MTNSGSAVMTIPPPYVGIAGTFGSRDAPRRRDESSPEPLHCPLQKHSAERCFMKRRNSLQGLAAMLPASAVLGALYRRG